MKYSTKTKTYIPKFTHLAVVVAIKKYKQHLINEIDGNGTEARLNMTRHR